MKKQQLLDKLDAAWTEFRESFAGLSDAQLTKSGVIGEWSVYDIIAHVTTWEEEALKYLPLIQEGRRPPRYKDLYGGIDAFNAQTTAEKRSLGLPALLVRADDVHRRLVAAVEAAPDEEFTRETRFRRRIRLDTYSHYPEHSKAIREWRERRS